MPGRFTLSPADETHIFLRLRRVLSQPQHETRLIIGFNACKRARERDSSLICLVSARRGMEAKALRGAGLVEVRNSPEEIGRIVFGNNVKKPTVLALAFPKDDVELEAIRKFIVQRVGLGYGGDT